MLVSNIRQALTLFITKRGTELVFVNWSKGAFVLLRSIKQTNNKQTKKKGVRKKSIVYIQV